MREGEGREKDSGDAKTGRRKIVAAGKLGNKERNREATDHMEETTAEEICW